MKKTSGSGRRSDGNRSRRNGGKEKLTAPDIRKGERQPESSEPEERAQFLILRANRLIEQGQHRAALESIDEAVGLWRRLTAARPDAGRPALALALGMRGSVFAAMEQPADAVVSLAESLRTLLPVLEKTPLPVAPLATSLLRDYRVDAKAAGESVDELLTQRVADILERIGLDAGDEGESSVSGFDLDAPRPSETEPEKLALYLVARSRHLTGLGHQDAALEAIDEAVEVWRPLLASRPQVGQPGLALALGLRGDVLRELVRSAEAAESFSEGLAVITPVFVAQPKTYVTLASALFRDYIAMAEEAEIPIDEELILPAFETLRELGVIAVDEDDGDDGDDDEAPTRS